MRYANTAKIQFLKVGALYNLQWVCYTAFSLLGPLHSQNYDVIKFQHLSSEQ